MAWSDAGLLFVGIGLGSLFLAVVVGIVPSLAPDHIDLLIAILGLIAFGNLVTAIKRRVRASQQIRDGS